jgi:hypothetical protein
MIWEIAILSIFSCYVLYLIGWKLYSPFWFHQPVYHTTELYPRLFLSAPYLKQKNIKAKKPYSFCDFFHIQTYATSDLTEDQWSSIWKFLQSHYLDSELFLLSLNNRFLQQQFRGTSYVSFYFPDHLIKKELDKKELVKNEFEKKELDYTFEKQLNLEQPIGCILSRPTKIVFRNVFVFPVHSLEYICVHRNKKQPLSRNLIQTHIYQMVQKPTVEVFVFKKEVHLSKGVVPLVQYKTFTFFLKQTPISPLSPLQFRVQKIGIQQLDVWKSLYYQILSQFEVTIMPEYFLTVDAIKDEQYHVYVLLYTDETNVQHVHGVYIWKNANITWDVNETENNQTLQLVASMIFRPMAFEDIRFIYFFRGFLHSMRDMVKQNPKYGILVIENISDNGILLEKWQEKYPLRNATDTAMYTYNLVYPQMPVKNEMFFCL